MLKYKSVVNPILLKYDKSLKRTKKITISNPILLTNKISLILRAIKIALKHYIIVLYKGFIHVQK